MIRPLALALALFPAPAAACRLALLLALDVSASVDAIEYRLQAQGMARALVAPQVQALMLGGAGPVALAALHWSGPEDQAVIADWEVIDSPDRLAAFAARIAATERRSAFDGRTAVGAAMARGAQMLAHAPPCGAQTIDVAADGEWNAGPDPRTVRDSAALAGITVNALAIGGNDLLDHGDFATRPRRLTRHLQGFVIRGPGAFVEEADDYRDFERAMTRKLVRELDVTVISAAD